MVALKPLSRRRSSLAVFLDRHSPKRLIKGAAHKNTYDTASSWNGLDSITPFGASPFTTIGQTFTVPTNGDTVLDSFTIFLRQSSANAIGFRGYLMAWDGGKATGPVLYESSQEATFQRNVFSPFNFVTGGINLLAGQQYVVFINASNISNNGSGSVGLLSSNPYPGGDGFFLNNGPNFSQVTTTNWNSIPSRNNVSSRQDLAFKASFSSPAAIPTPALLPGMLALGMNMWRKRRATTSAETSQV